MKSSADLSLTHLRPVDSSTLTLWTGPFTIEECLITFYYNHILQKFIYFMQNTIDPDHTPHYVASDLGL